MKIGGKVKTVIEEVSGMSKLINLIVAFVIAQFSLVGNLDWPAGSSSNVNWILSKPSRKISIELLDLFEETTLQQFPSKPRARWSKKFPINYRPRNRFTSKSLRRRRRQRRCWSSSIRRVVVARARRFFANSNICSIRDRFTTWAKADRSKVRQSDCLLTARSNKEKKNHKTLLSRPHDVQRCSEL